jgi:hypothetical protein
MDVELIDTGWIRGAVPETAVGGLAFYDSLKMLFPGHDWAPCSFNSVQQFSSVLLMHLYPWRFPLALK